MKSNASDYAALLKATYEAVEGAGIKNVTLLAAGFGDYEHVNGSGEGTGVWSQTSSGNGWIADMLASQPLLKTLINGWTSHPYGRPNENVNQNSGFLATAAQRKMVIEKGGAGYNNWWITEVGFKLGATGSAGAETEAEQASLFLEDLEVALPWHTAGWLRALFYYNDDSPGWGIWGKTAQTTFTTFAAAHAGRGTAPPPTSRIVASQSVKQAMI